MTAQPDSQDYPALITSAGPAARAAWDEIGHNAGLTPTTVKHYRCMALRFLRWLQPQCPDLTHVAPQQVEQFLDDKCSSVESKYTYRTAIRRFFDGLVANGTVASNPAHLAVIRRNQLLAGGPRVPNATQLDNQFDEFTAVERQALVDAAAIALLLNDIYHFTQGQGGCPANVARCEKAIQLAERYAITPFPHVEEDAANDQHRETEVGQKAVAADAGTESPEPEPPPLSGDGTAV